MHRTMSYNEMSARYIPIPNEHYIPSHERIQMKNGSNKQAQGSKDVSDFEATDFQLRLQSAYDDAEGHYRRALEDGIPKELARLIMPVGRYSKMRASANLRNWLQFLTLRLDSGAQYEIRQYAQAVEKHLTLLFPRTMELFNEND